MSAGNRIEGVWGKEPNVQKFTFHWSIEKFITWFKAQVIMANHEQTATLGDVSLSSY